MLLCDYCNSDSTVRISRDQLSRLGFLGFFLQIHVLCSDLCKLRLSPATFEGNNRFSATTNSYASLLALIFDKEINSQLCDEEQPIMITNLKNIVLFGISRGHVLHHPIQKLVWNPYQMTTGHAHCCLDVVCVACASAAAAASRAVFDGWQGFGNWISMAFNQIKVTKTKRAKSCFLLETL